MTTRARRKNLDPRAKRALTFLRDYARENDGRSPTLRELCEGADISSTSAAVSVVERLEASGHVTRIAGQARSLRLVEQRSRGPKRSKDGLVVHAMANRTDETDEGEYRHRIRVEYVRTGQKGQNVRAFTATAGTPAESIQRASAELMKWLQSEVGE